MGDCKTPVRPTRILPQADATKTITDAATALIEAARVSRHKAVDQAGRSEPFLPRKQCRKTPT